LTIETKIAISIQNSKEYSSFEMNYGMDIASQLDF